VRKLNAFVRLSPDELACLAELQSRRRSLAALTETVHEGQTDHCAWILQEGWANCYKLLPDDGRQIINFPLPGGFIGLRSILSRTSDHSFACLTDAVLTEVPRQRISEIFDAFPRIAIVTLFFVAEHWNGEGLGWHVARHGNRYAAAEALAVAVRSVFGSVRADAGRGVSLRHDHGSAFMSDPFQNQLKVFGMAPSFAFVRQPETSGVAEWFIRTLK
jgi:hypothetical protein